MKKTLLLFVLTLLSTLTASAQTDLTGAVISLSSSIFEYDGTAKEPKVSGIRKGTKRYNSLIEGTDYDIAYANNVNIGEATVTLTFKGEYTGVATQTFTISPIYVSSEDVKIELDKTEFTYDGTEKKPGVTVFYKDKLMVPGVDYDLAYSNNIEPGKATVTATFKGYYEGSAKSIFLIIGGNGIVVNETNFPDAAFRNWILNQKYGKDGLLTDEEIANVTSISITDDTSLKSLQGIELFTALKEVSFTGCSGLTSLRIPNGVTSIGNNALRGCSSLTEVIIPNSVTEIGLAAFMDCIALTSVTIPNSVTSIGNYVFQRCSSLTSVAISNSVTSIGDYVFQGCSSLTSVAIPNSVTSIGLLAFDSCTGLTSLTIGNCVTSIGNAAFFYCNGLTSITIPSSVTSIGTEAFAYCSGLTSIIVESGNTKYDSRYNCNAIIETETNTLITGSKNTIIPSSVTSIGNSAFRGCYGLTSITIPNSVTSIGNLAFGSTKLKSIDIPNGVTTIGNGAFEFCSSLTSITIPNSVTSIEREVFYGCNNLTDFYCYAEIIPATYTDAFNNSSISSATLHVQKESIESYKATLPWNEFGSIIALELEKKCATPTISYADGKVTFSCETEGVEFVTKVTSSDSGDYEGTSVSFSNQYIVNVYAKKDGYKNSDVATEEITVGGSTAKKGDVNEDGKVNGTDIQEVINIIVDGE